MLKVKFKRLLNENTETRPQPERVRFIEPPTSWSTAPDSDYTGVGNKIGESSKRVFVFGPDEEYIEEGMTHAGVSHALKHMADFIPERMIPYLERARKILEEAVEYGELADEMGETEEVEYVYLLDGNLGALRSLPGRLKKIREAKKKAKKKGVEYKGPSEEDVMVYGNNKKVTVKEVQDAPYGLLVNTLDVVNDKGFTGRELTKIETDLSVVSANMLKEFTEHLQEKILDPRKWVSVDKGPTSLTGTKAWNIQRYKNNPRRYARTKNSSSDDSDYTYYTIDPNAERFEVIFTTANNRQIRTAWSYGRESLKTFEDRVAKNLKVSFGITNQSLGERSPEERNKQRSQWQRNTNN